MTTAITGHTMRLSQGAQVWVPTPDWRPRVVAVDEDGTFLRTHTSYNRKRFEALWPHMAAAGTRFVVASGNQYWQIRDFFPNHAHEIAYVSANGSYVEDIGGEAVFAAAAAPDAVAAVIAEAHRLHNEPPFLMSGVHGAYIERTAPRSFVDTLSMYFHKIAFVDDLAEVHDQIFMFSTQTTEKTCRAWMNHFAEICGGAMVPVYSGEGYFDLVVPGVNKAQGLAALCERWGVAAANVAAFGDSENDLEMLSWAGAGYAMDNAAEHVKATADGIAPANTEDGVLQLLEAWFAPSNPQA